ncbi:hypothetical protein JZ751_019213, partial [Albula glossodonta]
MTDERIVDSVTLIGKDLRRAESQTGEERAPQRSSERKEKELPVQRIQKLVGGKKGSPEEGRGTSETSANIMDSVVKDDSPVMSCIGLAKKPEKKPSKDTTPQKVSENVDRTWGLGSRADPQSWASPSDLPFPWDGSYHTCRRPFPEHRVYNYDFTLPRGKDWNKYEYLIHENRHQLELSPPRFIRSITDLDICDPE